MQDLNDMLYFAEVVDHGSFAAAARSIGVPKSTISRRVANLEASLSVRLLQRTTRKLSLTVAGEIYFRHCVALRNEAQAAEDAVAVVQSEPRGTIRMTCPITLAHITIAPILPEFMARYPKVRIEMRVTNRAIDLIEEGVDIALRVRPSLDASGSLVIKHLGIVRRQLLVHSQLFNNHKSPPRNPEDLAQFPSVAMSAVDGHASILLMGPDNKTFELEHHPCLVADDLITLKHAITSGVGMGVMPEYICREELVSGQVIAALPGWGPPPDVLHAVFPTRRGMMPAVRSLLDFLAERATEGVQRI